MLFLLRFLKLLMGSYSKDGKYFVFEPEHFICHDYLMDRDESAIDRWGYWEHIRPSLSQGLCDIYDQGNYAEISLSGDKTFLSQARDCIERANKI